MWWLDATDVPSAEDFMLGRVPNANDLEMALDALVLLVKPGMLIDIKIGLLLHGHANAERCFSRLSITYLTGWPNAVLDR